MLLKPQRASELPASQLEFLMPPYIYRGLITIISGPRSSNKSTFAAHMAAKFSRGQNPFDPSRTIPKGTTLYYSLEDDVKRVTAERIAHFGGDDALIKYGQATSYLEEAQIAYDFQTVRPAFVIIDTLSAFLGSSLGEKKINTAFSFLTKMAEKYNCGIIIIHHPKRDPRTTDEIVAGAERILNFARMSFYIGRDATKKDRRYLAAGPSRYGKEPPTIQFRVNHEFKVDKITVAKHLSLQDVLNLRRPDKNHCAVRALASGARIEYDKAEWIYREAGRERWDGTSRKLSEKVLRNFGTRIEVPQQKPYLTLKQFIIDNPSGHYIVAVKNHMLSVNNGKPSDSTGWKKRIECYWKLYK